ncbi:MAG: hypothetical protein ACKOZY_07570, partial [Flavobacteriales bacterium]
MGWSQIAQRGTATSAISTTATVTINKPTGVVAGDMMIANIGNFFNGTNTSATSSGWTLIAGTDVDRGRATLLYKIAGASEPASYTFDVTAFSSAATGAIVAFSGVDNTTPFDVAANSAWYTATSTSLSNIPSVSTVTDNSAVVMFGMCSRVTTQTSANFLNGNWTTTSPANLTELFDVGHNNANNTPCVGGAWATKATFGATGLGGLNCNVNTSPRILAGTTIALRPANAFPLASLDVQTCQNFNTLPTTGTSSTLPVGWYFNETGSNANTTYTAGTGSASLGDTYGLGATGSTDRALGGLLSSSLVPTWGAKIQNTTGNAISIITISYTGETWRVGATNRSDRIDFQYSTNATSLTTGTWVDVNALDYSNPGQ